MSHPYGSQDYALSLRHIGETLAVPEWSGHVLKRSTPCGRRHDAIGAYPLAAIAADADLAGGLDRLRAAGCVSIVIVVDDRLRPPLAVLDDAFDSVRRFKTHLLHDRRLGPPAYSKHHRYEIRRAAARTEVREIALAEHLPEWEALYGGLVERHGMGSLHAFPATHHAALAELPSLRTFGGFIESRLVAAHLFVVHEGYGVSHLAASSTDGYAAGAAYAVNDFAITALTDCELINFGGGAGTGDDPSDGLVRFKKGFANAAAASHLCARVLDTGAYRMLSAGFAEGGFFPAYRGQRTRELADAHPG